MDLHQKLLENLSTPKTNWPKLYGSLFASLLKVLEAVLPRSCLLPRKLVMIIISYDAVDLMNLVSTNVENADNIIWHCLSTLPELQMS